MYKAAKGCFLELFDQECHPAVLYFDREGNKSQAIPGKSTSSNFFGTIISGSFKITLSCSSLKPIPLTFFNKFVSLKSSTFRRFDIA